MSKQNKKEITPFHQRLALNQWLLTLFEADSFQKLAAPLKEPRQTSSSPDSGSHFYQLLPESVKNDDIKTYDYNIAQHTQHINQHRDRDIQWKYFQYLALLFTEIYLDRYFSNPKAMTEQLNQFLKNNPPVSLPDYTPADLSKIALWSATGSGKTLMMHINILQYLHYLEKYNQQKNLNRIILLTPNEGLSAQHLEEFKQSNIEARIFNKNAPALLTDRDKTIEIIEVTKLDKNMGEKRVAVESFENNNLVLVDEGHRGSSGEKWMSYRKSLCRNGFSFEYSATFGQAFGSGDSPLAQEYAKCILFDYSYKFFYGDGYGKNFHILNFSENTSGDSRHLYLTACLLTFYQQLKEYEDKKANIKEHNIEKPLWVFVGHSVNALQTKGGEKISDVLNIILFLADFINNQDQSKKYIKDILHGEHGILVNDRDVFENKFAYLKNNLKDNFFEDIKTRLFNGGTAGKLCIEYAPASGEIVLKIGDNQPFGLVSVGDASALRKLCATKAGDSFIVKADNVFSQSYFNDINKTDSTINILIGAKKFTEGWNSWRVSTMGLMNVGKGEGAQIIQLFGRGVRLKGRNFSLKRSNAEEVQRLETLNVFGIRASYMEQFNKYLKEEGVSPIQEILLPVLLNFDKKKKLKVIRVRDGLDYKKDSKEILELSYENNIKISLDLYPKIQSTSSSEISSNGTERQRKDINISQECKAFVDVDKIYLDLQELKQEYNWHNLSIPLESIRCLLEKNDWYSLYVPQTKIKFLYFSKEFSFWQETLTNLIKKYTDKFYKTHLARWEQKNLEYQDLQGTDANLLWSAENNCHHYTLGIDTSKQDMIDKIISLGESIKHGNADSINCRNFIFFKSHLYEPLIISGNGLDGITVKPVPLNEGEANFVSRVINYVDESSTDNDKEFYLLRNQSKKGIGFFESHNFYPDFILWVIHKKKQYIAFIDPHGFRHTNGIGDEKIQFSKKIKEIEKALRGSHNIILNSFILSTTPYNENGWWNSHSRDEFKENNVYFMENFDMRENIIDKMMGKTSS